jgi:hypothetical protein
VDGQLLVERFSLAPETTYCLQFLYVDHGTSYWGQHGAQRAPGLDSIRVVAPGGEYNIGWAILRGPVDIPDAPVSRSALLNQGCRRPQAHRWVRACDFRLEDRGRDSVGSERCRIRLNSAAPHLLEP